MLRRIVTIGVYGFDEATFFEALRRAKVNTFCDTRFRRGVRGAKYAFANSRRLQAQLSSLGIAYLHCRDLAPSRELRARQTVADQRAKVGKRQRPELSPEFIEGYRNECLRAFRSSDFVRRVGPRVRVVALFCVEGEPAACHRMLVAERLATDLGVKIVHLKPD
jgi:hypothetical protein